MALNLFHLHTPYIHMMGTAETHSVAYKGYVRAMCQGSPSNFQGHLCSFPHSLRCEEAGNVGMNPSIPLEEPTSWMVLGVKGFRYRNYRKWPHNTLNMLFPCIIFVTQAFDGSWGSLLSSRKSRGNPDGAQARHYAGQQLR